MKCVICMIFEIVGRYNRDGLIVITWGIPIGILETT